MSNCSNCGFQNPDGSNYCSKCGANLKDLQKDQTRDDWGEEIERKMEKFGEDFGKHMEEWGNKFGKNIEDECFGFRGSSAIVGLIFGLLIILVGLGILFEWDWSYLGAFIIIVIGAVIVLSTILKFNRRKK